MTFLQSKHFWQPFVLSVASLGCFFAWELGYVTFLPSPARPEPTQIELLFAAALAFLLALNIGLLLWRKKHGSCPIGAKRASGVAGAIGAAALICPACILAPFTLFGLSISLVFLAPFLPLLRVIALLLLIVSTVMLWPKK